MTDHIRLAVFRDCEHCKGKGTVRSYSYEPPRRHISKRCDYCRGEGNRAIYIPLPALRPDMLVRSIQEAVFKHEAAVDDLAAQLDASGLVEDPPAPEPSEVDAARKSGMRHGVQLALAWLMRKMVDERRRSDRSSYDMAWRDSVDMLDTISGTQDMAWLDTWLERMQVVVSRPITGGQAPAPAPWPEHPAKARETPDLAVAAKTLVDALKSMSVFQSVKSGKTRLQEAMVEVLECLDGRGCALPRPYRVESALAMMDTVAKNNGLEIPDTVCLLHAILLEAESLASQVIANAIGHDVHNKLRNQVALEVAGDGDIVSRVTGHGETDERV